MKQKERGSMPWYTTGLMPGSFKNTIAGADSTPNLSLIIWTMSRSYTIWEDIHEALHFGRLCFKFKLPTTGLKKSHRNSLKKQSDMMFKATTISNQ